MVNRFRRLHLLVEGQTEEIVVNQVLEPYLAERGWSVSKSLFTTKRPGGGPNHKGGITGWSRLKREIQLLLRDSSLDVLTTLIDYYAFPDSSPGMADRPHGDAYTRVAHVEKALCADIGDERFLPHLVLHELEAWVFAAADELGDLEDDPGLASKLRDDVIRAGGPELVNDGVDTAPSKRLKRYSPGYIKTLHGPIVIESLGVESLRGQCPHFARWLAALENLA